MTSLDIALPFARPAATRPLGPLSTLARRRFQLTARTPRELVVPLLTPIMFALVIAPALKTALHTDASHESFVAIGTVGLLIPLNTMFSGLSVIVDRTSGAQRELLTAPIPRGLLVLGNLLVALAITALQVGGLIAVSVAGEDAFTVGSRVTVPLHEHGSREAIAAVHELGLAGAISAREPTLDDVYLRLTGDSLAAAA